MTSKKPAKKAPSKRPNTALAKPYEPTPREMVAIEGRRARLRERPSAPRLKVMNKGGVANIRVDHKDMGTGCVLLMEALGTADLDFFDGLISQLANVGSQGSKADESGTNFMLSMVKGIGPKDEIEAMLAVQMAAVHNATMTLARRLKDADTIVQSDAAERTFNKLARTFTTQMAALKQYRTGGQQKMTVEHVHVHDGGQAIVGNVQGGGGSAKKGTPTP